MSEKHIEPGTKEYAVLVYDNFPTEVIYIVNEDVDAGRRQVPVNEVTRRSILRDISHNRLEWRNGQETLDLEATFRRDFEVVCREESKELAYFKRALLERQAQELLEDIRYMGSELRCSEVTKLSMTSAKSENAGKYLVYLADDKNCEYPSDYFDWGMGKILFEAEGLIALENKPLVDTRRDFVVYEVLVSEEDAEERFQEIERSVEDYFSELCSLHYEWFDAGTFRHPKAKSA